MRRVRTLSLFTAILITLLMPVQILLAGITTTVTETYQRCAITAYFPKDSIRYNLITRIISTGDPRSALEDLMNSELDLSEETKGE